MVIFCEEEFGCFFVDDGEIMVVNKLLDFKDILVDIMVMVVVLFLIKFDWGK